MTKITQADVSAPITRVFLTQKDVKLLREAVNGYNRIMHKGNPKKQEYRELMDKYPWLTFG